MNINLEQTILRNLLTNEEYTRRVLPFLVPDYFEGVYKDLFKEVAKFVSKYNKIPTLESFKIEVDEGNRLSEEHYRQAIEMLPNIFTAESENLDWLIERTEKWCQDRSVYNAVMESISIIDGKHATLQKNAIPGVLSKALGVSFDTNIGHDYLEQVDERYDYYHEQEERIPFDLDNFNKITKGGLPNKTLNIALAGTGVGKSLFMCHLASNILSQGRNVLYITMEMAEEKISERIDANLLNLGMDEIKVVDHDIFSKRINKIKDHNKGKLIVKGVMSSDDAVKIKEMGADAIQVSNHGGRQLDSASAAINILPFIREAVGNNFPIIFDSGIRSGSDIVRSLALGADFSMIGRPVMYAMGADGASGLRRIVDIIKEETSTTLGLVGLNDINEVSSDIIEQKLFMNTTY